MATPLSGGAPQNAYCKHSFERFCMFTHSKRFFLDTYYNEDIVKSTVNVTRNAMSHKH